jgi:hypothetical protein
MPATYEPIATQTLGSAATGITFSSVPSTYTDLRVILVQTTDGANLGIRFNSDSGSNYSWTRLQGDGSSATSARTTSATFGQLNGNGTSASPNSGLVEVDIFSYAGSTNKTLLSKFSNDQNGSGNTASTVNLWRSTAAITTVYVFAAGGSLQTGSTATLYGIKNA